MIRLKSLLLERNYNYQIPEDKQKLLYDFYMISFLKTLNFNVVGDQRNSGNNIVSVGMVRGVSDSTKVSFQEAKNKLIPTLKKHLLDAVFFAVCAEFRHIFDNNSDKTLSKFFKNKEGFIKNYISHYGESEFLDFNIMRNREDDDYEESYKAVMNSGINKHEFITIAKEAFLKLNWASNYGGKPWTNICEGWLNLNNATDENKIFIWIDHVYDLQHNTNTVFNKVQSYYKNGYYWIKRALDHKAKIKNPLEIIDEVSGTLRSMALEILKGVGYGDYEQFVKKAHIPPTVVSNSSSTSTNKNISWTREDGTWFGGTWRNGTWENGTWEDGYWENGIWNDGTWEDGLWEDGTWNFGTWHDGIWFDGIWNGGTWKKGTWHDGIWNGGIWEYGIWNDGAWHNGTWEDGTWKKGTWEFGYWEGGTWKGGVWENGTWKDGTWEDGTWINGSWEGGEWQGGWILDPKKKGNFKEDWEWKGKYVRSPISPKEYFS